MEIGGLFLIDELGKGAPEISEGVGIAWATLEYLCRGNVNFLFTTHFAHLKQILNQIPRIKWAKFESFIRIERTTNKKILSFTHKIAYPERYEEDEHERPDYGYVLYKN